MLLSGLVWIFLHFTNYIFLLNMCVFVTHQFNFFHFFIHMYHKYDYYSQLIYRINILIVDWLNTHICSLSTSFFLICWCKCFDLNLRKKKEINLNTNFHVLWLAIIKLFVHNWKLTPGLDSIVNFFYSKSSGRNLN